MPGPAPPPIELTSRQQHLLEKLLRASSTEQRLAQRAEIILMINQSRANNQHVARGLRLCRQTVGKWRTRWADAAEALAAAEDNDEDDKTLLLYIEATLADAARSGARPHFSAEAIVEIIALACEDPVESERPVTHWTPRELADEAVKRGIVKEISPRSVGRFLKRGSLEAASEPVLAQPGDS